MIKTGCFLICLIMTLGLKASDDGYNISVTVNGIKNQDIILGYYYNKQMYVSDTATTNSAGTAIFSGEESLKGGLYLFYLPNGRYFDVLIDKEQKFSIRTDTLDLVGNMSISGAKDPSLFLSYQKFISERQKESSAYREKLQAVESDSEEAKELRAELTKINQKVEEYWENITTNHPESFTATFIKSMQEPSMPEFNIPDGVSNPDSLLQIKRYRHFRDHYFDNIDFTDERLLRTPFFVQRLENYFDRGIIQIPDTIADASIRIIEKSRDNATMFRFLVQYFFNRANESNIMGMDAAMVALAEKYYLSGDATWASEQFLMNLQERVTAIKPTLIGKTAQDLRMQTIDGGTARLHAVDAKITIIVFYEPSCGHCKKELPKLYKDVFLPYRDRGVEVFAVYSLDDMQEWNEFVDEHGLHEWINVFDPFHQTRFRQFYDIRSTPMLYVLDRDKKIAGKRIDAGQLPGFIEHLLRNYD
ncbi:peroxiredoxin [Natronoflexus pectinivorans]|uniref:Peroxiredoxin n=2 Tax=Natronoflexus pectinivorans TaxID=682526 RepID=A0A4R2GGQ0_9BACT|nr:peroxiredoxin [Natronoflexus pectinivorans]